MPLSTPHIPATESIMARARKPHVIRLTTEALTVTSPTGRTTNELFCRMNVPAPAPAFVGVYVVPGLPAFDPPPVYWAQLAEWIRRGWRIEPPYAPRPVSGRLDLERSWDRLERLKWAPPRNRNGRPEIGSRMPSFRDQSRGLSLDRQDATDVDLSNLTLPRTFIRRCVFTRVNFRNTDLTESRLCWNDFTDCDFRGADLTHCDLRASRFRRCKFGKAVLAGADFRRSTVARCTFRGADTWGVIVDLVHIDQTDFAARLTPSQRDRLEWHEDPGEEPEGS